MKLTPKDKTKKQIVIDAIMGHIQSGALKSGDRMPGIRQLAQEFDVSFAVINDAYNVLEAQKVIIRHLGSGTFINPAYKFRGTRLVALLSSYRRQDIEDYYEPLLEAANEADVLPILGILPCGNPKAWEEVIHKVIARDPDLILIDVEGRLFPLQLLKKLLKDRAYRFVNRWEWDDAKPEQAILHDYVNAYAEALLYLKKHGHRKIIVHGFHLAPLPFMKKRLEAAAERAGLKFGRELFSLPRGAMKKDPKALERLGRDEHPTAVFVLSDYLMMGFMDDVEKYFPALSGLEKVGMFHSHYSTYPGHEFASVPLNFSSLWKTALDQTEERNVVLIPPDKIQL